MCELHCGRENLPDDHQSGRPQFDYIDTKAISILEKAPFESVRSIAQVPNVDHAPVLHRLHEKLRFKSYCLRCVPHLFTRELKPKHKELTGLMILYLVAARKKCWRPLVTGDESCFSFSLAFVGCGLWPKMRWQQKLGPMSRAKVYVYNDVEPTWVPCHRLALN
jgi:hypothetical protein